MYLLSGTVVSSCFDFTYDMVKFAGDCEIKAQSASYGLSRRIIFGSISAVDRIFCVYYRKHSAVIRPLRKRRIHNTMLSRLCQEIGGDLSIFSDILVELDENTIISEHSAALSVASHLVNANQTNVHVLDSKISPALRVNDFYVYAIWRHFRGMIRAMV